MPTVGLNRDQLFVRLGQEYTQEEFEELCFEFGIELDDVTSEYESAKEMGAKGAELEAMSKEVIYRIDVPANRYDLLCMEGMARALRIFRGLEKCPEFVKKKQSEVTMTVKESTEKIRPYCVCAILRGLDFTDDKVYASFIDLQEKLHQNICRRRTLVAIGTHDLATLEPPFTYSADDPDAIEFVPLTETEKSFKGRALLDHYRTSTVTKHLKPYTEIIYDSPVYPIIRDSKGTVLSLPPIINSRHSRIQRHTKDVFIECTATDETKATVVLDTICAMFSEYCSFTVESVPVTYMRGNDIVRTVETPALATRECSAMIDTVRGTIGLSAQQLPASAITELCAKMQLAPATLNKQETEITVTVPCTRSDILHAVDVVEDVAIAYGYNNVPEALPKTPTVGGAQPLNAFCDLLRDEVSRAGYTEILTHGLCKTDENYQLLRRDPKTVGDDPVVLLNPASEDFEIVRTTLLVGILKTLQHNKSQAVKAGVKLFEISDVVYRDSTMDVGARNDRRLVATYTAQSAGFEILHGLLDRVMAVANIVGNNASGYYATSGVPGVSYVVEPHDSPTFFPGRAAKIILKQPSGDLVLGFLGVVHPLVLQNFDLDFPTSALEIKLEPLFHLAHPAGDHSGSK